MQSFQIHRPAVLWWVRRWKSQMHPSSKQKMRRGRTAIVVDWVDAIAWSDWGLDSWAASKSKFECLDTSPRSFVQPQGSHVEANDRVFFHFGLPFWDSSDWVEAPEELSSLMVSFKEIERRGTWATARHLDEPLDDEMQCCTTQIVRHPCSGTRLSQRYGHWSDPVASKVQTALCHWLAILCYLKEVVAILPPVVL